MTLLGLEEYSGSLQSNVVNEDIAPFEVIDDVDGTGLTLLDGDESDPRLGIVLGPESAEWIHEHDRDTDAEEYKSADNDRAPYVPHTDGAVVRCLTIPETTDGQTSSPSIGEGNIVGVPDTTVTDGATGMSGRIVEEGYSNDENNDSTSTTFNRSNGNFIPIGRAAKQSHNNDVTGFEEQVRVRLEKDLMD